MIKMGMWFKESDYQELRLIEPLQMEELEMCEKALKGIIDKCKVNEIHLDDRWEQTIKDFLTKAKERMISSQVGTQGDYEHANQVDVREIVQDPEGGGSEISKVQTPLDNNNDANVGS